MRCEIIHLTFHTPHFSLLKMYLGGLVEGLAILGSLIHRSTLETEHAGHDVAGEHFASVVQFAGSGIEEPAGGRKLVLDVGKFCLQLQEVLVGLQLGVGFQRNAKPSQRTRKGLVRLDLFIYRGGIHGSGTGGSYLLESFFLMGGITLDGIYELRHQVKSLLELHIDIRKGILAVVAKFHQAIQTTTTTATIIPIVIRTPFVCYSKGNVYKKEIPGQARNDK